MGEVATFTVLADESRPYVLRLSEGLAIFSDSNTHSTVSFSLQSGHAEIDYHEVTGHIRIANVAHNSNSSLIFRVLSAAANSSSFSLPSGDTRLNSGTKSCLSALRTFFKGNTVISDAMKPETEEYSGSTRIYAAGGAPLPSAPLSFVDLHSKDRVESPVVARVTAHILGKPTTAFQVRSLIPTPSSAASSPPGSPSASQSSSFGIVRIRLHASFAALGIKLQTNNPKIPGPPSNWRRDQLVLQRELDMWLQDVVRMEPRNPALLNFLLDTSDSFTAQDLSGSSGYLSYAFGSMMEPKPYQPLFPSNQVVSPTGPYTLIAGSMGSSKSSLLNQLYGLPVCDPVGTALQTTPDGLVATFYEVLPTNEFCKMAKFPSYWTHQLHAQLANYPPGAQALVVGSEKLQESIGPEGIEGSWKRGGAFFILEHAQVLERYRLGPPSAFRSMRFRSCIINEAALDPIRLEFEIGRTNIFVELNNFDRLAALTDTTSNSSSSTDNGTSYTVKVGNNFMQQLLEVASFRQQCARTLYCAKFDDMKRNALDFMLLEISELVCKSKDSFQFSDSLSTWIGQSTINSPSANESQSTLLDLSKMMGLMRQWANLLPTPRRNAQIVFFSTESVPTEFITSVSKEFQIHNIFTTEGRVLTTRDSTLDASESVLSNSLSATASSTSTTLSVQVHNAVYEYLLPTELRSEFYASLR